jgi:hypothetical protein
MCGTVCIRKSMLYVEKGGLGGSGVAYVPADKVPASAGHNQMK